MRGLVVVHGRREPSLPPAGAAAAIAVRARSPPLPLPPPLALEVSAPMSAQAETALFGGKTIKIIVGMPPGGGVDSYARLVQRHLGRFLSGTPGIVGHNMPG